MFAGLALSENMAFRIDVHYFKGAVTRVAIQESVIGVKPFFSSVYIEKKKMHTTSAALYSLTAEIMQNNVF